MKNITRLSSFVIVVLTFFASDAHAHVFDLELGIGADTSSPTGLSAKPNALSSVTGNANSSAVLDGRALIFPFGSFLGLGWDIGGAGQGSPQITSSQPILSNYTKYTMACASSNAVVALDVIDVDISKFLTERVRLVGMTAIKTFCELDYQASGLVDYKNTGSGKSWGAAVDLMQVLKFLQLNLEVGYKSYKSGNLTDPTGNVVTDTSGNPVTMDLSAPYVQVSVGLEF